MASIKIVKYKIRRGTDSQRRSVVLDQGELVYTLDTQRLYVGNGVLSGGISPASKIHATLTNVSSLSNVIAEVNDIVIANNVFYQLTSTNYANVSSWVNVGTKVDSRTIQYNSNNILSIGLSSLSAGNIDPVTISNGLKITGGILQTDYSTKSLEISSNKLAIKAASIDEREIASSTLGNGLSGGSGSKIGLLVNPVTFSFSSGVLQLSSIPAASLTFASINSSWIGSGLSYNSLSSTIDAVLTNTDNSTIVKSPSGIISLNTVTPVLSTEWSGVQVDSYGRVSAIRSSVFDTLQGVKVTSALSGSSLSGVFTGTSSPSSGVVVLSSANPTIFQAVSSNLSGGFMGFVSLTSAGFIAIEGSFTSRSGKNVSRIAIPVYTY